MSALTQKFTGFGASAAAAALAVLSFNAQAGDMDRCLAMSDPDAMTACALEEAQKDQARDTRDIATLEARIDTRTAENEVLADEIAGHRAENEVLADEIAGHRAENEVLADEIAGHRAENEVLAAKEAQLNRRLWEIEAGLAALDELETLLPGR